MESIKYLIAFLSPWISFYIGDKLLTTSGAIFHHPCSQVYMGCLYLDLLSYGLKGLIFSLFLSIVHTNKMQQVISYSSLFVLVCLIHLRNGEFPNIYWFTTTCLPFAASAFIGYKTVALFSQRYNKAINKD